MWLAECCIRQQEHTAQVSAITWGTPNLYFNGLLWFAWADLGTFATINFATTRLVVEYVRM